MEKRIPIGMKLPPSLVRLVDEIRESAFDFPPTRTEVIERAIIEWCERTREKAGKVAKGKG